MTSSSDPKVGGQEKHVLALSKHLANIGHDVTLLTCESNNPSNTSKGFKVAKIDFSKVMGLHLISFKKLVYFLSKTNFDICHLHHETLFGEIMMLAKRKLNFPLVTTLHTSMNRSFPAKHLFDRVSLRFISSSSDKVICLSPSIMQNLVRRGLDGFKCVTIPNALDVTGIEDQLRDIQSLSLKNETMSDVLFVGRLEPRKGLRWLIDAFSLLHKKGKKYTLRIVGHGPMLEQLREKISENNLDDYVSVSGYIPKEELLKSYLFTKVVVIPSLYEGVPTVALEAMAARKPLIITDIPGLNELVVNGCNGLIVPPKDSKSLAKAIDKILLSPNQHLSSIETINRKLLTTFSWDAVVDNIVKTYCEAITTCC
ncbi:MAG: glycosyltransferase family 4 protein [Candidatus Bathyarchaeum tardum]|nr:MAG: glycosyltransferase family 4 protein [Candidatus Bathyarchaeum tardum]